MKMYANFQAYPLVGGYRTPVKGTVHFEVSALPASPEATIEKARIALRYQNPELLSTPIKITRYGLSDSGMDSVKYSDV